MDELPLPLYCFTCTLLFYWSCEKNYRNISKFSYRIWKKSSKTTFIDRNSRTQELTTAGQTLHCFISQGHFGCHNIEFQTRALIPRKTVDIMWGKFFKMKIRNTDLWNCVWLQPSLVPVLLLPWHHISSADLTVGRLQLHLSSCWYTYLSFSLRHLGVGKGIWHQTLSHQTCPATCCDPVQ